MITKLYKELLKQHGPQGWWPINNKYHPNDFSYPKNREQIFEISVGAILTQNTSWKQVEKSLNNLREQKLLTPNKIITNQEKVKQAIKPSGYFNQKYKKLKLFSEFFKNKKTTPSREELLSIWGVGKETADSILLYAYKFPIFPVDTYTKRLFLREKIIKKEESYETIRLLVESQLPKDYKIYQEFHALIVENEKVYKQKKQK